ELAPRDARLRHNRQAVWTQWALALLEKGKEDEALTVLRRAAAAVPDGHFTAMQAWVFIRKAEGLVASGEWEKALAAIEPGFERIDKAAAAELRHYRAGLRVRWAHAEIAGGRFPQAVDVLAKGMEADPDDRRLPAHLAFAVQEHAASAHAAEGEERARAVLVGHLRRFDTVPAVRAVAAGYVWSVVKTMIAAGRYEEALAFIDRCGDLLSDKDAGRRLAVAVYDAWADSLAEKKDHEGAIRVYRDARKRHPRETHVARRAAERVEAWVNDRAGQGAWDDALDLYEKYRRGLLTEEEAK